MAKIQDVHKGNVDDGPDGSCKFSCTDFMPHSSNQSQIAAVRKNVIEPMMTLLKLYEGPQKLTQKRNKRLMDYARFKAIKDRGDKPDKKTIEQGEQFVAVNDTLKDELPKLFSLTGKLVEACLNNFVQLQLQWHIIWRRKLSQASRKTLLMPLLVTLLSSKLRYFHLAFATGPCSTTPPTFSHPRVHSMATTALPRGKLLHLNSQNDVRFPSAVTSLPFCRSQTLGDEVTEVSLRLATGFSLHRQDNQQEITWSLAGACGPVPPSLATVHEHQKCLAATTLTQTAQRP